MRKAWNKKLKIGRVRGKCQRQKRMLLWFYAPIFGGGAKVEDCKPVQMRMSYRRFVGSSNGKFCGVPLSTSMMVTRLPTIHHLKEVAKELEELSNVYVTSINCSNFNVTVHYKRRFFKRFFRITV